MTYKLMIVGDFPALNEVGGPFTNGYWRYLKAKLSQVGIPVNDSSQVIWRNVINTPGASIYAFTQKGAKGALTGLPAAAKGHYLRPEFASDILKLYSEIRRLKPNLVLAVGELPLLALTHQTKPMFARGRVTSGIASTDGIKILPCYHPRSVMADQTEEPVLFADLAKAKREMQFPELRRPQRYLHLRPSIDDLESFYQEFIVPSEELSIDIETKGTIITCVGVAPSPERALVIPFYDEEKPSGNYWETAREERIAWDFVRRLGSDRSKATFGQNFSYDVQYLWRFMGIPMLNWRDDTMILHHALQPEMQKGLGFLASIYTDELAWKFMAKNRAANDRGGKKEDA